MTNPNFFQFTRDDNEFTNSILEQSSLLIGRLNQDEDINIPKVKTLLNKEKLSFRDNLFSTFESLLLLCKKIGEFKEQGFELEPWFEQKVVFATEHLFMIRQMLSYEQNDELDRFIINFYAPTGESSDRFPKPVR